MSEPGPEPLEDTQVVPFAERLLDCLCIELGRSLGGPVCQCCLRPGMVPVPMDTCYCNCPDGNAGQASVQITDIFPSSRFPRNQIDVWDEACAVGVTWVAELTMTVYRCVSTMEGTGQPPTCEQLERDFRVIQSDAAAMRRAFACCSDWALGQQIRPGGWKPIGPMGACAGGFMSVLVDVGPLCCPVDEPG
jgi:hypothetical protein